MAPNGVTDDAPPPDGGPGLFAASFLGLPMVLALALVATSPGHRAKTGLFVLAPILPLMLGSVLTYFSRTRSSLLRNGAFAGFIAGASPVVVMYAQTRHIQGDDVLPLFFLFIGPMIAAGGGVLGLVCSGLVAFAFAQRQFARIVWLQRVTADGASRYRLVLLSPSDKSTPYFLRYRGGEVGLARVPSAEYRGSAANEIIGRVPRQLVSKPRSP